MKYTILLLMLFVVLNNNKLAAQIMGPQATYINNFSFNVDNRKAQNGNSTQFFYLINNKKTYGTPFLFNSWQPGVITMADGKVYEQYVLKYNIYNQELNFKLNNDSLVVDTDVASFTVVDDYDTAKKVIRFVHANGFGDKRNNRFYEVLNENEFGVYLRFNKKIPVSVSTSIVENEAAAVMEYQVEYFYYNKATKKNKVVKNNNSNWTELLNDAAFFATINLKNMEKDFNNPDQVIELLQKYKTYKIGK